jgi:hypothetical protein
MLVGKALLTPLVVGCWANFGTTGADTHSLKLVHASDGRTVVQDTFAESELSPQEASMSVVRRLTVAVVLAGLPAS